MQAPGFWRTGGWQAVALAPLAAAYAAATARRMAREGWRAPVPVLCCGNAGVGGAGKTTLALDLGARLLARGRRVAFLTRGHGGRVRGVLEVDPGQHDASLVGDEPLLLAECAPTFVAADRARAARAAVAQGADVLVMDDGLQNPSLHKDASLLVIDGAAGFGNGRVIPAGPLREPVAAAAARCVAAVLIGADATGALAALPATLPVLRAALRPGPGTLALAGKPVLAFAGIGRPAKFFATLVEAGADLVAANPFPDHHPYTIGEILSLLNGAEQRGAVAATTPKDAVRLPPAIRARLHVADVTLAWEDEAALGQLLDAVTAAPEKSGS
jgi:tetraacyldisaccharide 4'-kinase